VLNVILDLTGGVLSLLQLIGDCADLSDWSGITGNPAKMALALVTICFDLIFLVQHYLLYPESGEVQSYSAVPTIQTK
jgi:cystinosin